jgi:phage shock protein A
MTFFRRVAATLSANIDQAISRIENHDAVIDAALNDARHAAAELKVRLAGVRNDMTRTAEQIEKLKQDEARWSERAQRVAAEDETRALNCLRRRNECRDRMATLLARQERSENLEHRLAREFGQVEQRLADIDLRRQELRGRELSSKSNVVHIDLDTNSAIDVDRAFERWEVEVTHSEFAMGRVHADQDDLGDRFERSERDAELRAELDEMINAGRKDK